ncbi:MAG: hypothetical protein K2Y22_04700 [Candidatus Obscuribacterales bacterium]|nr:hypothetical protein [Candidatus Obscuribacterales bacterium]
MKLSASAMGLALTIALSTCLPMSAQMPAFDAAQFAARQKSLSLRIDDAVLAGRLSNSEGDDFRARLKKIADTEAKFKDDGLMSNWESVVLSFQMDGLSKKLEAQLRQRQTPSQNVDGLSVDLNQRIDDAQDAGQLTDKEAMAFKEDLDKVASKEEKFRRSEGTLSEAEKLELSVDLDLLSKTIEDKLANRLVDLPNIDKSKMDLHNQLVQAKDGGKINQAQYQQLTNQLDRIYKLEADLKASENKLTTEEAAILALEFEQVGNSLNQLTKGK